MLEIPGERYEYEMNVLLYCSGRNIPIREIPVQTVYINGTLVKNDVPDYVCAWPLGTGYEITDVKPTGGHSYDGVTGGSLSGQLNTETTEVWLSFSTNAYPFTMNSNGGSGSMNGFTSTYGNDFTLPANAFTKDGYSFTGWNVKRDKDNKWYVGGKGWYTENEISSEGYTKCLYQDKTSYTFNEYWTDGYNGVSSYTFYAVWQPNQIEITYNSNGADSIQWNGEAYKRRYTVKEPADYWLR